MCNFYYELRDLEAELLNMVCTDVEIEPVLQDISGGQLGRGSNRAPDARLDIHARGFWENQRSAFFDVRVCHPNADSYRDLELQLSQSREREEAPIREEGFGHRTRNFYTPYFHVNRRHGKRVLAIPLQTGAADLHQERRTLC